MQSSMKTVSVNKTSFWTEGMIVALAVLCLFFDNVGKRLKLESAIEEITQFDYAESLLLGLCILSVLVVLFF